MISIKEIKAEDTVGIRKEVLRKNMDLSAQFTGDHDVDTIHVGLYDNDVLACVVSFMHVNYMDTNKKQYQLRGMATKEKFQGKGFGKKLLEKSEEILKSKNTKIIWCNVRVKALGFYIKLGFNTIGNSFDIPPIGRHYVMIKQL
ncbi:MAG: GNAT family N-acetyltransferase [Flavobacteriaceae bacterium]|nr:GNAT family N-acetyltransferase [Flavobacteriaceae bacterium]